MPHIAPYRGAVVATMLGIASVAGAGVINPNISVVGQPFSRWTDDAGDPAAKRAILDAGETEFVYDDYLNPYARGFITIAVSGEGAEVEEGYFNLLRGLPLGLTLKGGKYRVGFGRLNPVHPHAVPFAERFRVMAFLPGGEAFNETGVQLSARIPVPSDWSVTASADVLQGDSFRLERPVSGAPNDPRLADGDRPGEPRPGLVGRLTAFGQIGDRSGIELGLSGTHGTNNVAAAARTTVLGGDAKLKLWTSPNAYLLVQGELLHLRRDDAGWDGAAAAYTRAPLRNTGGYLFADYNFRTRYNVGASFERFEDPAGDGSNQAFGAFAGLALLEETTAFRVDWNRYTPGTPAGASVSPGAVNTVTVRAIYSMGPHKAHQF
ncbi:MAG: hypothetical protein ACRENJ_05705 [Candidatus Eiseniibacteriota bacterium]